MVELSTLLGEGMNTQRVCVPCLILWVWSLPHALTANPFPEDPRGVVSWVSFVISLPGIFVTFLWCDKCVCICICVYYWNDLQAAAQVIKKWLQTESLRIQ